MDLYDLDMLKIIILMLAFFMAGLIDSIAGGGGAISLPAMLLMGLPAQYCVGTNKLAALFGTFSALLNYIRCRRFNVKISLMGIVCGLIGSACGSKVLSMLDSEIALKCIIFLLPLGALISLVAKKSNVKKDIGNKDIFIYTPLIAICIGFYDGFFGPGTGSFLILAFLFILKVDIVEANIFAKTINLATNIGSFLVFSINGQIFYTLAIFLIISNVSGNLIGSTIAMRVNLVFIKMLLFLVFLGLFIILFSKYIL